MAARKLFYLPLGDTSFAGALAGIAILIAALVSLDTASAQTAPSGILAPGNAIVTGFSGAPPPAQIAPGQDPGDLTFIDPNGPSAQVFNLQAPGAPPQAQVVPAPISLTVTAAQVGQVFGVTLDNATPPNMYVAASSAYGLPIVVLGQGGAVTRVHQGAPGATFMAGLFGPAAQGGGSVSNFVAGLFGSAAQGGGPGSIWRIDGVTGAVSLFANVILNGAANSGPALGGIAFDADSSSLLVADRQTGMIHRFNLSGTEIGRYDHGVQGLAAAGLPQVPYTPIKLDITNPQFSSDNPATWDYAAPQRLIFGLGVHIGRLYYAVAAGLQIWSVSLAPGGSFGTDARMEVQVPPAQGATEISKIAFDDTGDMILAERGAPTGDYELMAVAQAGIGRVLRYAPAPGAPGLWQPAPDQYAIGFPGPMTNANGGVAIGYSYDANGNLDRASCGGFLWSTGEQLRNAADPNLAALLAANGSLYLNGMQGNAIDLVEPANVPPLLTYFVDYDAQLDDPAARGHMGDIAIPRTCGQAAGLPDWYPPSSILPGSYCPQPGIQCCPYDTYLGNGGQCQPICPNGAPDAASIKYCILGFNPEGPVNGVYHCFDGTPANFPSGCAAQSPLVTTSSCPQGWVRAPDPELGDAIACQPTPLSKVCLAQGMQVGLDDTSCQQLCAPGSVAFPTTQCCALGQVPSPNGICCPLDTVPNPYTGQCCPLGSQIDPWTLACFVPPPPSNGCGPGTTQYCTPLTGGNIACKLGHEVPGGCCPPNSTPAPGGVCVQTGPSCGPGSQTICGPPPCQGANCQPNNCQQSGGTLYCPTLPSSNPKCAGMQQLPGGGCCPWIGSSPSGGACVVTSPTCSLGDVRAPWQCCPVGQMPNFLTNPPSCCPSGQAPQPPNGSCGPPSGGGGGGGGGPPPTNNCGFGNTLYCAPNAGSCPPLSNYADGACIATGQSCGSGIQSFCCPSNATANFTNPASPTCQPNPTQNNPSCQGASCPPSNCQQSGNLVYCAPQQGVSQCPQNRSLNNNAGCCPAGSTSAGSFCVAQSGSCTAGPTVCCASGLLPSFVGNQQCCNQVQLQADGSCGPPPPNTNCQSNGGSVYCAPQQNLACPSGTTPYNGGTCLATEANCPGDLQMCCYGNSLPNFATYQCCPPNDTIVNNACVCPGPLDSVGYCCPPNDTVVNGACVCAGTVDVLNVCCPTALDANGYCPEPAGASRSRLFCRHGYAPQPGGRCERVNIPKGCSGGEVFNLRTHACETPPCPAGKTRIAGVCACPAGQKPDIVDGKATGKCVAACKDGEAANPLDGRCWRKTSTTTPPAPAAACRGNYALVNGTCVLCAIGEVPGQNGCVQGKESQPTPVCPPAEPCEKGQTRGLDCKCTGAPPPPPNNNCQSNGGSVYCAPARNGACPSGSIPYNGACLATGATCAAGINAMCCPGNSLPNFSSGQCCPPNTILQGGSCVSPPPPRCPAGSVLNPATDQCCPPNTIPQGQSCVPPPPPTNCGPDEELVGGRCQCLPGYVPNPLRSGCMPGLVRTPTPPPTPTPGTPVGVESCTGGEVVAGKCECPRTQVAVNGKCGCPLGTQEKDGVCSESKTPPPSGGTTTGTPVGVESCTGGTLVGGKCECPRTQVAVNGKCGCPPGTQEKDGICSESRTPPTGPTPGAPLKPTCTGGEELVNGSCQCPSGEVRTDRGCEKEITPPPKTTVTPPPKTTVTPPPKTTVTPPKLNIAKPPPPKPLTPELKLPSEPQGEQRR